MTQRPIKFRAWNEKVSKMIDLKAITPLAMDANLKTDGLFIPFEEGLHLMQFTGLKDKNGKECYEGDLVNIDSNLCKVKFNSHFTCGWDFEIVHSMGCYPFSRICKHFNNTGCKDFEIIGNIYENSDLLKPQTNGNTKN